MQQIKFLTTSRKLCYLEFLSISKLAESDYLVLEKLSEAYPEACDRDTLLEYAWPGRIVTNSSLKVSIHKLRKILKEELNLNVDVVSVRYKGYVLSSPITMEDWDDNEFFLQQEKKKQLELENKARQDELENKVRQEELENKAREEELARIAQYQISQTHSPRNENRYKKALLFYLDIVVILATVVLIAVYNHIGLL